MLNFFLHNTSIAKLSLTISYTLVVQTILTPSNSCRTTGFSSAIIVFLITKFSIPFTARSKNSTALNPMISVTTFFVPRPIYWPRESNIPMRSAC